MIPKIIHNQANTSSKKQCTSVQVQAMVHAQTSNNELFLVSCIISIFSKNSNFSNKKKNYTFIIFLPTSLPHLSETKDFEAHSLSQNKTPYAFHLYQDP